MWRHRPAAAYLESKGSTEEVCRVYLRRIMHTYYKFDYKAHRRSLGLQGETKVTGPYYIYLLNILYMHFFYWLCCILAFSNFM